MKSKILYSLMIIVISICFLSCKNKSANAEATDNNNNISFLIDTIDVEGMTCEGCENAIKTNVTELKGIGRIEASYITKNVIVKYDTNLVKKQEIINKITETGYTVVE